MPNHSLRHFATRWLTALLVLGLTTLPVIAAPSFLVDADWLAEHLEDENLIVSEVRYRYPM